MEDILGLSDRKYLYRLSEAVLARNASDCLSILEEAYLAGVDMKHFYAMLLKHFRNLLLVKIAADGSSSFDIAPEQVEKLKIQTNNTTRETLQRYLEILIAEEGNFRRSQEPRMKLETIIVKMAYLEPILPLGDILSTIENIEKKLQNGASDDEGRMTSQVSVNAHAGEKIRYANAGNHASADSVKENHATPKNTSNLKELIENLKKFIKKENPPLGGKIDSTEIISYENDCLTIGVPNNSFLLDDLKTTTQMEKLQQITGKFFQKNVTIKIESLNTESGGIKGDNGRSQAGMINDIKRDAMRQPILRKVMSEISDARVVEIKVNTDKINS